MSFSSHSNNIIDIFLKYWDAIEIGRIEFKDLFKKKENKIKKIYIQFKMSYHLNYVCVCVFVFIIY